MKKIFLLVYLIIYTSCGYAADKKYIFTSYFKDKTGCFILYDLNQNKLVEKYNQHRCATRISPDSTFKIALSLMAFDQHLITQKTIFKWDGQDKGLPMWNHNQTPHTWLSNSVVWVSRELTPQLGMDRIKDYLKKFNYGNENFSGDPGKNNGLMQAWLSNSLKISADEEVNFLMKLLHNQLPVSKEAIVNTKDNMYLKTSPNGWKLYGKTGTGNTHRKNMKFDIYSQQDGWFVGYIQKAGQTYIFALNFSDKQTPKTNIVSGIEAKEIALKILAKQGLF